MTTLRTRSILQREGSLLVDAMIAISVLTVGIVAMVGSMSVNDRATSSVNAMDRAQNALDNLAEELRFRTLDDVYVNFNGTRTPVAGLEAPDGGPALLEVTCFVDESNLPAEFGGLADIDGKVGTKSVVTANHKILPVRLRVDFFAPEGPRTREVYLVLSGV